MKIDDMKGKQTKPYIMKLLGMTEMEYELELFEAAYKYLDLQAESGKLDDEDCKELVNNPYFWFWWKYQWENRNRIVLAKFDFTDVLMVPSEIVRKRARNVYDAVHEVSKFNLLINRFVMRMTFARVCLMSNVKKTAGERERERERAA